MGPLPSPVQLTLTHARGPPSFFFLVHGDHRRTGGVHPRFPHCCAVLQPCRHPICTIISPEVSSTLLPQSSSSKPPAPMDLASWNGQNRHSHDLEASSFERPPLMAQTPRETITIGFITFPALSRTFEQAPWRPIKPHRRRPPWPSFELEADPCSKQTSPHFLSFHSRFLPLEDINRTTAPSPPRRALLPPPATPVTPPWLPPCSTAVYSLLCPVSPLLSSPHHHYGHASTNQRYHHHPHIKAHPPVPTIPTKPISSTMIEQPLPSPPVFL